MSSRTLTILAAACAPMLIAADKPVLVPDISARNIQIRYSFTGAQLLLFGAIVYPGGRPPTEPADIVVVLRGPVQPILVREKQKIAGLIWMNAEFGPLPLRSLLLCGRLVKALVPAGR